jgi:hypothetical protein
MGLFIFLLLMLALYGLLGWYVINVFGWGKYGQVKSFKHVPGAGDIVMPPNDTDNPWMQRVYSSSAYGQVPKHIIELLRRVSADENEKVIAAVWTRHGRFKMGYLVATTNYLRWIETFPFKEDEFWQYNAVMETGGMFAFGFDKVLTIGGNNYQVKGMKRANEFQKLYKNLQQGLLHEDRQEAEATPSLLAVRWLPGYMRLIVLFVLV